MKSFRVRLAVSLNDGMLDPQGEAIARTLQEMTDNRACQVAYERTEEMKQVAGEAVADEWADEKEQAMADDIEDAIQQAWAKEKWQQVDKVRVGKLIEIDLRAPDVEHARSAVEAMSEQLLTHPVTEKSEIVGEILELAPATRAFHLSLALEPLAKNVYK